ncbi:hypothetical protein AM500_05285 [Bacillus sp. FJAT-18017]|uniref:hypothetical protein n=1 Tax=Bacillus sp. FJAT-18017 TaxID=1705566 RepID=UPI0006AFBF4C|nr:hypothetical protein [Bacillus sp. FJAT-18017]ALC89263.1 hypothetical protein AM500_05285 [Bacillus sp. FJAT-18017]
MKKIWLAVLTLALALALGACSNGDQKADDKESKDPAASTEEKANPKKALVQFYNNLVSEINAQDAGLGAYMGAEKPTAEEKTAASDSAANVAKAVSGLEIPEELKDQKADMEAALKDFSTSYEQKAEELKKDTPAFEESDATFAAGQEKLGKVFEAVGLRQPDLSKEVN